MLLHQKMIVVSVAAAAGLMVAGATYAQTSPQAPPPTAPAGLSLTPAQREEIRTLREAQRKDAQPLREKMRTARRQLQQAMRADVPDEAAIRSAAGAVAALQADQAVQQARARAQFMSVLTPEQQARMKQARARAARRAQRVYAARLPFRTTHQMRAARTRRASRPLTANSISVE
jgi:Spy/CpxP family protein refolding chaperone